ncbi:DUF687 family protein [Chlamydia vaughanii]|uniref:DUF687 family protein n=1 Tax=Chlamydia vaughanii TaxID=3112552 RepID=UPI0032B2C8CB
MNRLTRTLAAGDSSAEAEFNPVPSNCRDILIATLFSIFRTSALVQEVLIISVTDQPDVFVTYVLVSGYSLNWLRYFFLFFTNSRCLRDRCRRVRLFARAFEPVFLTLISLDCGNCVRRYGRSPAILPPIFVTASTITGSILFFEGTRNLFRGLRGRVQRCLARRLNAPEEQRAIVRRPDGNRIGAIQGLMAGMHFGYLCFAVGVLNQILIQTPRLTSRANSTEDSGVYSHQLANASYAWGSGDMLGVSQTINFCFCMIVAAVNVILMVGLFQRNRRRQ